MTRYIIDIPSNRVIFFTEDVTVPLRAGREAIVYEDLLPPPTGMTLANAWTWKLFGRTFQQMEDELPKPPGANSDIDTLEENKKEVLKVLNVQINLTRKSLDSALTYNPTVIAILKDELYQNNDNCPMLKALAKVTNSTVADYRLVAQKRVQNYHGMLIQTEQWYQYYLDKINSASTVNELGVIRDEIGNRNFKVDLF